MALSNRNILFNNSLMKNFLIVTALAIPFIVFATPAENTETPTLALNFEQVQDLNTIEDYQMHQKGRSGDSGFRSMDYRPFQYDNSSLINKLYKQNVTEEVEKPGVVFGYNCFHWKNCLKDAYRATDGYNQSYKNFKPDTTEFVKAETRGNMRGRKNQLDGERSGLYKVERWGR
jgi:hypothetical protein